MPIRFARAGLGVVLTALLIGALAAPSSATGTVRVQQSNGSVKYYRDAKLRLKGDMLRVVSADGWGTIVVHHAACTAVAQLVRCLPYSIALDQNHVTHAIGFRRGALYMNVTNAPQSMPYSSTRLPAGGIELSIVTARGTYVSVRGRLDVKQ